MSRVRNINIIIVVWSSCGALLILSLFVHDGLLEYYITPQINITDLLSSIDIPPFYGRSGEMVRKFGVKAYANYEHQFMHCLIQKNTNTMFRNLWFAVERNDTYIYHLDTRENNKSLHSFHDNLDIYWLDQRVILNVNETVYSDKVRDREWLKMVIIRDPLERLLSGFLDRCIWLWREHGINTECFGNVSDQFTFTEFVDRIINQSLQRQYVRNPHYWPQSWFCRMNETLQHYQMVIPYDRNTIGRDTLEFLKRVNLSQFYWYNSPHLLCVLVFMDQMMHCYDQEMGSPLQRIYV